MRTIECLGCGTVIENACHRRKRCEPCAHKMETVYARQYKRRMRADDSWREKRNEETRAYHRRRYISDDDFRERAKESGRNIHHIKRSGMMAFLRWLRGSDCSWCGESLPVTDRYVEIDHRLPKSLWPSYMPNGSVHAISNLQLLHAKCYSCLLYTSPSPRD